MQNENPFASPQTAADAGLEASQETDAERIRREHLSHEASIQSMGVLFLLGGIVGVIAGVFMLVGALSLFTSSGVIPPNEAAITLAISLGVLIVGVLQFWVAFGLRKLRSNARVPGIVLSVLGLINIPIGTLISGYFLYLLMSAKGKYVLTEEYRRIREATPLIKYKTSKIVWAVLFILIAVIVLGVVGAIVGLAFRYNR